MQQLSTREQGARSRRDNFGPFIVVWQLTPSLRFIKMNPKPHLVAVVATKSNHKGKWLWVASNIQTKRCLEGYANSPHEAKRHSSLALVQLNT